MKYRKQINYNTTAIWYLFKLKTRFGLFVRPSSDHKI